MPWCRSAAAWTLVGASLWLAWPATAAAPPTASLPSGNAYLSDARSTIVLAPRFLLWSGAAEGSARRLHCLGAADAAEVRRRLDAVARLRDRETTGRVYLSRTPQELTVTWRARRVAVFTDTVRGRRTISRPVRRLIRHVLRLRRARPSRPVSEHDSSTSARVLARCRRPDS